MIPVYLANTENKFDRVMLYNGYVPTTHEGLVETINDKTPLTTPAMVQGYLFPQNCYVIHYKLKLISVSTSDRRNVLFVRGRNFTNSFIDN